MAKQHQQPKRVSVPATEAELGRPAGFPTLGEIVDAKPACGRCKHFGGVETEVDGEPAGRCRRFPPSAAVVKATPAGPLTAFGLTLASEWCGEFQARGASPGR